MAMRGIILSTSFTLSLISASACSYISFFERGILEDSGDFILDDLVFSYEGFTRQNGCSLVILFFCETYFMLLARTWNLNSFLILFDIGVY